MDKEIAFSKADLSYLKSAAQSMGIETRIPPNISDAQVLRDKGIPTPGDLDPSEAYLLSKIANAIKAGATSPDGFIVYLNDRMGTEFPETDFKTVLFRQQRAVLNKINDAIAKIASQSNP